MVLERLGARHVRAVTRATRAVRQLSPAATLRHPLKASVLAPASPSAPADRSASQRRTYTAFCGPKRAYKGSKSSFSEIQSLNDAPTLEAWSQQLRELDGPVLRDLAFWDEAFSLAKVKFQVSGIHATFNVFFGSGYGPSENISLYDSKHFPVEFLQPPRYSAKPQWPSIEGPQRVQVDSELGFLREFCSYIRGERSHFGRKPSEHHKVYRRVLSRVLSIAPERIGEYHELLSDLSPSTSDIVHLIVESGRYSSQQAALQKFYLALPISKDAYEEIIQPLCQSEYFPAALSWHKALAQHGHGPQDPTVLEPLIAYLYKSKKPREAERLERFRKDPTPSELEAIAASIEKRFPQGRFQRSEWNDDKSARIYATRFLSLNAVVSSLSLFNVRKIGSSSVREVLLRCSEGTKVDLALLQSHLESLEQADIAIDPSVYCRLAQKLLKDGSDSSLYHLATMDIHPDEFDDTNLLNSIFARLDPTVDAQKWHLITNALLVDTAEAGKEMEMLNILLRRSVMFDDDGATREILDKMQASQIPATPATLQVMYQKYMGQHRSAETQSVSQVDRFERLLSSLMENGSFVSPTYWDDVLRSLLFLGALDAHEKLCMRIAWWYGGKRYRWKGEAGKVLHPLETSTERGVLFRPQCVNEIIMYYMYHGRDVEDSAKVISKSQPAKVRAGILASHPVLRGLRLLLRLREIGVNIDLAVIQRVLRTRIWIVCRTGCKLASGVVVKRLDNVLERDYHLAAEILIGSRDPVLQDMRYKGEREKKQPFKEMANAHFDHETDSTKTAAQQSSSETP